MLDCLREADRTQKTLCQAQQQLARSTLALVKNHKTKFTTDRHQVVYRSTDSVSLELAVTKVRASFI